MSYDVSLWISTGGDELVQLESRGMTSNVAPMWAKALGGVSLAELNGERAADCIERLAVAVARFERDFAEYVALNPSNGYGNAEGARDFLRWLLDACRRHPLATVRVYR